MRTCALSSSTPRRAVVGWDPNRLSMVLAVLDALGRNETLFSPKLLLWAQREACERADLSCFFASLPTLPQAAPWRRYFDMTGGGDRARRAADIRHTA